MRPDDRAAPPPLRIGVPSRLGEMLIRRGLVSSEDVQAALAEQAAGSEWRLGRLLVRRGALDDWTLVQAIAHQFHVPVVDLRVEPPSPEALARLAGPAARQLQALPVRIDADALVVAVSDPPVRELRVAVERSTGLPVRLVLVAADELTAALDRWYPADAEAGADAIRTDGSRSEPRAGPGDAAAECEPSDLQLAVWILGEAVRQGATAVHLDHTPDGLRIRSRVDGALVPGPSVPAVAGTLVCHRLLAAAALDPTGDGVHEGAFDTVIDGSPMVCRVAALASPHGTHVVLRPAPPAPAGLDDLGLGPGDLTVVREILREGRGTVVVAAPPGAVATSPGAVAAALGAVVGEVGPDRHVVVAALQCGFAPAGTVVVDPDRVPDVAGVARALGADVVVSDAADEPTRRAVLGLAADRLLVLGAPGDDPSDVVADLVSDAGAAPVAETLRAVVVVGGGGPGSGAASLYVVTDDVRRAILDLSGA